MFSLYIACLCLVLIEGARRCCAVLLRAYTGPLSKIPGPTLYKITSIPWMIDCLTGNMMHTGPELFKKYGDIVRVAPTEVIVADKASIQQVLVEQDLRKAPIYEAHLPPTGADNLISVVDKARYRQKRRLLAPGFSISSLNALEPLYLDCIKACVDVLDAQCVEGHGSAVVDMYLMFGNLTTDIMSATSFGGSFNLVSSGDRRLKHLFMDRMKRGAVHTQFPFLKYLPFVPPAQPVEFKRLVDDILRKRKGHKGPPKKDLLQLFIDANKSSPALYSEENVIEEMCLFMIAGSDTAGATATFTLLLLLNNREKLRLLVEEIDREFPSEDEAITIAKTQDLPYLNAVINESMRVMPIIASGLPRYTTEATVIGNSEIPRGVVVSAYVPVMMKDPRIWPDPESFVPERWLGLYKGVEVDRKAYLPFSAGSRNCPGQQFALKELRLIFATLIRRYELSLVPGQSHELRVHTVPWLTQGFYNVGIKPRVSRRDSIKSDISR